MSARLRPVDTAQPHLVRTERVIAERFQAGESIASIAHDYGKPCDEIEDVIRRWTRLQERRKRTVRIEGLEGATK